MSLQAGALSHISPCTVSIVLYACTRQKLVKYNVDFLFLLLELLITLTESKKIFKLVERLTFSVSVGFLS